MYFGIPLTNFFVGWWLAAALITLAAAPEDLQWLLNDSQARSLALIYSLTWLLQSVGLAAFWGQPLPGLCGFMGWGSLWCSSGAMNCQSNYPTLTMVESGLPSDITLFR